ncbi:MAG TPA: 5-formyltetrahydrofolate cyclo-ligase [Woeseiaceae bacterium]|nr:5-formyltetrahydrofolate cyclo-ligase [Woeseiaceae bacterium]
MSGSVAGAVSATRALQSAIRRDARQRRDTMPEADRTRASAIITNRVTRLPIFVRSRLVACYLSIGCEVDTSAIILRAWRMKKRIFVPDTRHGARMTFREIRPDSEYSNGPFGIQEPTGGLVMEAGMFDLVIVPVVAFDSANRRIGMGGGFYDRTFSFLRHRRIFLKPKLVGVAFARQRVDQIAPNPWDIRLFRVITEAD